MADEAEAGNNRQNPLDVEEMGPHLEDHPRYQPIYGPQLGPVAIIPPAPEIQNAPIELPWRPGPLVPVNFDPTNLKHQQEDFVQQAVAQLFNLRNQNFRERAPGYALIVNYQVGNGNADLQRGLQTLHDDTDNALKHGWENLAEVRGGCESLTADLGRFFQDVQASDLHFRNYFHQLRQAVDGLIAGQTAITNEGFKSLKEGAEQSVQKLSEQVAQDFQQNRDSGTAWSKKMNEVV